MPRGLLKFIGFLFLLGTVGVVSVQGCTTSSHRDVTKEKVELLEPSRHG